MKAVAKAEYVGQTHPALGYLVAGVVYEVESLGELFEPAPATQPSKEPAKGKGVN